MGSTAGRARMLGGLITASHLSALEHVPAIVAEHAARHGWTDALVYVADLQQTVLRLLTGVGMDGMQRPGDVPQELQIDGTVPGRAFQAGEILPSANEADRWWVPLLDGTERVGLMQVTAPEADDETMRDLRELAGLVALLLVSKRGTSDAYARLVRRERMNVAAEMEWRLMPPRTFATDRVMISALMEPAYQVSGDVFDYAVAGDMAHLNVFDAMGHDVAAGLTANLAVAAARNYRRQGASLVETSEGIDQALIEQFDGSRFTTGVLVDLDMATGELSWVNRGHPPPVVIRGGRTVFGLDCPPAPPMGMGLGLPPVRCREQLEPGDRLLLYTDGITEARDPKGKEFGLEQFTDFLVRHHSDGLPVPETLRRLIRHHLDYHQGQLEDDATVVVLEWHSVPYGPGQAEALVGLPKEGLEQPD